MLQQQCLNCPITDPSLVFFFGQYICKKKNDKTLNATMQRYSVEQM